MKYIVSLLVILSISIFAVAETKGKVAFKGAGSTLSCTVIINMASLPNTLYKNANLHGGRGRSFLDQGHRFGGARRLYVAGANKKIFSCFGLYKCDSPYGCRYYQAQCNDGLSNSNFIKLAKQNGGNTVLVGLPGARGCLAFPANASRYGNIRK